MVSSLAADKEAYPGVDEDVVSDGVGEDLLAGHVARGEGRAPENVVAHLELGQSCSGKKRTPPANEASATLKCYCWASSILPSIARLAGGRIQRVEATDPDQSASVGSQRSRSS